MRTTVSEIFLNGWRSSKENLGDADLPAPAHIAHDSDSERPAKVALTKRRVLTHFPKDRNYEVSRRKKMTRAHLQKTHWRRSTSSRKIWWLDNSRSQSPEWGVWIKKQSQIRCSGSRSCHSMDSILSVQNKKNFTGDGKEFTKVDRAVTKAESSWNGELIHWNSASPVKIYRGIIALQHLIDPRRMVLLNEPQYCNNRDWMKNGALILRNAIAICEMSKTSWQMGRLLMKDGSEIHSKDQ